MLTLILPCDLRRTAALRELYEETGYGGGDKGGGKATVRTVTPILVSSLYIRSLPIDQG